MQILKNETLSDIGRNATYTSTLAEDIRSVLTKEQTIKLCKSLLCEVCK
jgi:hypothetical protein